VVCAIAAVDISNVDAISKNIFFIIRMFVEFIIIGSRQAAVGGR